MSDEMLILSSVSSFNDKKKSFLKKEIATCLLYHIQQSIENQVDLCWLLYFPFLAVYSL